MPRARPLEMTPFWRELLIQSMRLPVRLALRLQGADLNEMKKLMGIALFRELKERGYAQPAISLVLGCSLRTVKNLARDSQELDGAGSSKTLHRIIDALRKGPISGTMLADYVPLTGEFNAAQVALWILVDSGLVVKEQMRQGECYRLSNQMAQRKLEEWKAPLAALEEAYHAGVLVVETLLSGPCSHAELLTTCRQRSLPDEAVTATLERFQKQGVLHIASEGGSKEDARISLAAGYQRLIPEEPMARLRLGMAQLLDKLGWTLEFMLDGEPQNALGQRTWLFEANPSDLPAFIQAHRDYVFKKLTALEARARGTGSARRCVMTWALSPIPTRD